MFAGFGGDDFIAHQQLPCPGTVDMMTKEPPKQRVPRDHRREKALHSAVATPCPCPARAAQYGDPSRHHQHGPGNPAAVAQGRCRDMGLEALEKCYNVHRGLLRRLRVEGVVDDNSTTALRQKPFHVSAFWRRYGYKILK